MARLARLARLVVMGEEPRPALRQQYDEVEQHPAFPAVVGQIPPPETVKETEQQRAQARERAHEQAR